MNEHNPATTTDNLTLDNLGVLFNKQATLFNSDTAVLVEMVAGLRQLMIDNDFIADEGQSCLGDGSDEHLIIDKFDELYTYIEESTHKEIEALEGDHDAEEALKNTRAMFNKAVTLICYMDNLKIPTKYVSIDRTSIAALNEFQMSFAAMQEEDNQVPDDE